MQRLPTWLHIQKQRFFVLFSWAFIVLLVTPVHRWDDQISVAPVLTRNAWRGYVAAYRLQRSLPWEANQPALGTGLGLAICAGIIHEHGGRIWVEPTAHGGAMLAFTLPMTPQCRCTLK